MKILLILIVLFMQNIFLFANGKVSLEANKEEIKVLFDYDINIDNVRFEIKNNELLIYEKNNLLYTKTGIIKYKNIKKIGTSKELNNIKILLN